MKGRSLTEFKAAHDPEFRVAAPGETFERPLKAKRFIITAAQNATPVHPQWWATIRATADRLEAEILVIPLRYKNPTSQWSGSQRNAEHWNAEVRPYLWNVRRALNKNLMVLGDIKIQPTASSPLTGADALSHAASGIIGHTKVQLRSIPTPSQRMAKLLMTTGACTVENYTDSRAGRIGEFHHSLSAVLVEIDGPLFFARHLHWNETAGGAHDLGTLYTPRDVKVSRPEALVMGDTHVDFIDPQVETATFGPAGLIDALQPKRLVWHDLLDAYSCTPHHKDRPFHGVAKRAAGRDDVRAEVERAIDFLRRNTPEWVESIVVPSNHNDMLRRYMERTDWRQDPVNAVFYLETALDMARGARYGARGVEFPDPFALCLRRAGLPRTRVLSGDESVIVAGVELGMHGDGGPNGARGSIKNLRRIGVRSFIGHSHAPGIDEGCYQVGTSTRLRLEYNSGPSGWLNAHGLVHPGGKRQLVVIVDGRWRL